MFFPEIFFEVSMFIAIGGTFFSILYMPVIELANFLFCFITDREYKLSWVTRKSIDLLGEAPFLPLMLGFWCLGLLWPFVPIALVAVALVFATRTLYRLYKGGERRDENNLNYSDKPTSRV